MCERVIDLVDGGGKVVVIGTLFKDMPLRPSLLDEYRDEVALQGRSLSTHPPTHPPTHLPACLPTHPCGWIE